MIGHDAAAATITEVINSKSATNTSDATSGYIDVRTARGSVLFIQNCGLTTGTIVGKIQGATDSTGGGVGDIAGATFTASTGTGAKKCIVAASAAPYMRYVGTVTTGPLQLSVVAMFHPGSV